MDTKNDRLFQLFSWLACLFCFMILPTLITHWIPAIICYCWIVLNAAFIYAVLYGILWLCLWKNIKGHRVYSCIFGLGDFRDLETMIAESDGNMDKVVDHRLYKAPMVLILMIIGLFLLPMLSQSYLYA